MSSSVDQPARAPGADQPLHRSFRTFRAQDIPLEWTKGFLAEHLQEKFPSNDFRIDSLSNHPTIPSKTALVTFNFSVPPHLKVLETESDEHVEVRIGGHEIGFSNCLGMTTLFEPSDAEPSLVDVVFIHGLGGHAIGSWTAANGKCWPRDFLGNDLRNGRILSFGYEAKLNRDTSTSHLSDYGQQLLEELRNLRTTAEARQRPLFLIGHSFGGTIVNWALHELSSKRHKDDNKEMLQSIRCTTFFGTPHQGMSIEALEPLTTKRLHSSMTRTLHDLQADSQTLTFLRETLTELSGDMKVITCVEQKLTLGPSLGEKQGQLYHAVTSIGARTFSQSEEVIKIHADHQKMIKFSHKGDRHYIAVLARLKKALEECRQTTMTQLIPYGPERDYADYLSLEHEETELPITYPRDASDQLLLEHPEGMTWFASSCSVMDASMSIDNRQSRMDQRAVSMTDLQDPSRLCVQWVYFARKPLTPMELYFVILSDMNPNELIGILQETATPPSEIEVQSYILDICAGLVEISSTHGTPVVQIVHELALDVAATTGKAHDRLKHGCFNLLNIFASAIPNIGEAISTQNRTSYPHHQLSTIARYAIDQILVHANEAEKHGISQRDFLESFPRSPYISLANSFSGQILYSQHSDLLYILAVQNLNDLLASHTHLLANEGASALFFAAKEGNSTAATSLLDSGLRTHIIKDEHGRTPLSLAAEHGHEGVLALLVRRGADPHINDKQGRAALSWAAEKGAFTASKYLIEVCGVDTHSKDVHGMTPLDHALRARNSRAAGHSAQKLREYDATIDLLGRESKGPEQWQGNMTQRESPSKFGSREKHVPVNSEYRPQYGEMLGNQASRPMRSPPIEPSLQSKGVMHHAEPVYHAAPPQYARLMQNGESYQPVQWHQTQPSYNVHSSDLAEYSQYSWNAQPPQTLPYDESHYALKKLNSDRDDDSSSSSSSSSDSEGSSDSDEGHSQVYGEYQEGEAKADYDVEKYYDAHDGSWEQSYAGDGYEAYGEEEYEVDEYDDDDEAVQANY